MLMKILGISVLAGMSVWADPVAEQELPAGPLTLGDAMEAALYHNPELAALAWDRPIAGARTVQAGLRPNPELSIEIENIDIDGADRAKGKGLDLGISPDGMPSAGFSSAREWTGAGVLDQVEVTLRLSHVIELGGKRAARIAAASLAEETAAWDYEAARHTLAIEVLERFTEVLAAQEQARQARDMEGLARRLAGSVAGLADAGRVSPIEARRARAEAARLAVTTQAADAELLDARIQLAATWGGANPAFTEAVGDLHVMPKLADLPALLSKVKETPQLRRWVAELAWREALVALEDRNALPDLTLSLGYRASRSSGSSSAGYALGTDGISISRESVSPGNDWAHALTLEASMPIPLFNRNQGGRQEARLELGKTADVRRALESSLVNTLTRLHAAATAARDKVVALESGVVPELEKTYTLTKEGYEAGKFGFLSLLDAEQAWMDARAETTGARVAYHRALASIEGITGAAMEQEAIPQFDTNPAGSADEGQ